MSRTIGLPLELHVRSGEKSGGGYYLLIRLPAQDYSLILGGRADGANTFARQFVVEFIFSRGNLSAVGSVTLYAAEGA